MSEHWLPACPNARRCFYVGIWGDTGVAGYWVEIPVVRIWLAGARHWICYLIWNSGMKAIKISLVVINLNNLYEILNLNLIIINILLKKKTAAWM